MPKTLERASASSQTAPESLINKTINFVYRKGSFLDPSNLEVHVIKYSPGGGEAQEPSRDLISFLKNPLKIIASIPSEMVDSTGTVVKSGKKLS